MCFLIDRKMYKKRAYSKLYFIANFHSCITNDHLMVLIRPEGGLSGVINRDNTIKCVLIMIHHITTKY